MMCTQPSLTIYVFWTSWSYLKTNILKFQISICRVIQYIVSIIYCVKKVSIIIIYQTFTIDLYDIWIEHSNKNEHYISPPFWNSKLWMSSASGQFFHWGRVRWATYMFDYKHFVKKMLDRLYITFKLKLYSKFDFKRFLNQKSYIFKFLLATLY